MLKIHNDDTMHIKHDSMRERRTKGKGNICVLIKDSNSFAVDYTDIRASLKNILITDYCPIVDITTNGKRSNFTLQRSAMTTHHFTMENTERENRKKNILTRTDTFLNILHLMQSKGYQQFGCCDNMPLPFVKTVKAFCTDGSVTKNRQTNNATKW